MNGQDIDRDERSNHKIEAYFLGALALIVFGVVVFAALNTKFTGGASGGSANNGTIQQTHSTRSGGYSQVSINQNADVICSCYNGGFELAGRTTNVQSTDYRTGFSQCRAIGSVDGGNAWTAGWEARQNGRAFEASCKSYKRRAG